MLGRPCVKAYSFFRLDGLYTTWLKPARPICPIHLTCYHHGQYGKREVFDIRIFIVIVVIIIFYLIKKAGKSARRPRFDYTDDTPDFDQPEYVRLQEEERKRELLRKYARQSKAEPSRPEHLISSPHAGRRVLVADNSSTIRHSVSMVLEPEGFNVVTAADDTETWREIANLVPDVILLDHDLGPYGGHYFCDQLRRNEPTRDVPVIILSASDAPHEVDRARDCGAVDALARPFESRDLIERINAALDRAPAPLVCPVCDHPIEGTGETCPECGATHHDECWQLNDGCGSCGYRFR